MPFGLLGMIISLGLTIGMLILSFLFKIAGKLRLTLPLLYFLVAVVSTFFTDWTTEHEFWVICGFFVLVGLCVLSWIVSLIKHIRENRVLKNNIMWQADRAREMGMTSIRFKDGNLLDPETGEPYIWD